MKISDAALDSATFVKVHDHPGVFRKKIDNGIRFVHSNLAHELGRLPPELLSYFKMFGENAIVYFFP